MKNHCLNVCKAIAAFFIIFIHCSFPSPVGGMMNGLARFAVPLFFMVSGYFAYGRAQTTIRRRALKTWNLFLISNGVYFLWKLRIFKVEGTLTFAAVAALFSPKALMRLLFLNVSPMSSHLWFLGALLYCYLFYLLMLKKGWEEKLYWLIPVGLALNLLLGDVSRMLGLSVDLVYGRNFWLMGLPFFLWGHWAHERQERGRFAPPGSRRGTNLCWILIGGGALLSMGEILLSGGVELYFGSILMVAGLFVQVLTHPTLGKGSLLAHIGDKVSLHIYLWQMILYDVTQEAAYAMGIRDYSVYQWLMPLWIVLSSWLLAELLTWLGTKRRIVYEQ